MNVVVLAKWVPNPEGVPEMGDDFRLKREGAEGSLDPGDEFGVEAALQLADSQGGEVTVVSMGPESVATQAVRNQLELQSDEVSSHCRAPTSASSPPTKRMNASSSVPAPFTRSTGPSATSRP